MKGKGRKEKKKEREKKKMEDRKDIVVAIGKIFIKSPK